MEIFFSVAVLSADSWRIRINCRSTQILAAIQGKAARILCIIASFCKNIARLSSWEMGKTTRITPSSSIKQGVLQQPIAQFVYHPDHHMTRQSASDPQDTLNSPRYSVPDNFSRRPRQFKLIVIYDSLEALRTIQFHQVLPLYQSDWKPSVYVSSYWNILVDYLIFFGQFVSFSTFKRFDWTVGFVSLIFLNCFENFCPIQAL